MTPDEKGALVKSKNVTVQMKAPDDALGDGQFTGYASIFGNVDSYGDVVVAGAFAESLKSYGDAGAGIPCYWAHQMSDPEMCIGQTVEAREDERGLYVKVQLDLDTAKGAQVHRLIKSGRVNQMSFAFDVEDYAIAHDDEHGDFVELRKLKIHEVSVVQVGANQATELLDVKDRLTRLRDLVPEAAKAAEALEPVTADPAETPAETDASDPGDQPETPEAPDVPEVKAKQTGGRPDLALAAINTIVLEGATA